MNLEVLKIIPASAMLALCLPLWGTEPPGDDWPRFLGARGDNTSSETGLLEQWPVGGPPRLWARPIGSGYSAPSVRGDRLVLHHRLQDEEIVETFDTTDGKPLWRHAYPSRFRDPFGYNNGPRCTPLLTSNRCYTFGAEGKLLCLDLQTGARIWQRDMAREWNVPEAFFGVGSTPLLEGDKLIVMVGGQPNSGVVALDANTGKTLWENVGQTNWVGVAMLGGPGLVAKTPLPPERNPTDLLRSAALNSGGDNTNCLPLSGTCNDRLDVEAQGLARGELLPGADDCRLQPGRRLVFPPVHSFAVAPHEFIRRIERPIRIVLKPLRSLGFGQGRPAVIKADMKEREDRGAA